MEACPTTEPARGQVGPWKPRSRGDDGLGGFPTFPAVASSTAPPRGNTLARPQSITCTSPNEPTMMF